ncbi:MAG: chemotaxis protein CheW [Nitrospirota bacterium]
MYEGKGESESPDVRTPDYEPRATDKKLKKADTEIEEETNIIEILTFSLLKEEYAFRISQLDEILRPQRITMVPKMPDYVKGITSLRGKIIPVIDLKLKLFLTDKASDINHKGKILIIKGPKGPIGAAIDKVISVVRISKNEIMPPPSHLSEAELKFIEGVVVIDKQFISIINMEEAVAINLI